MSFKDTQNEDYNQIHSVHHMYMKYPNIESIMQVSILVWNQKEVLQFRSNRRALFVLGICGNPIGKK